MNGSTILACRSKVTKRIILATTLLAICARMAPAFAHSNDAAAAFAPWLGVWSLNIAKSDFGTAVPQRSGTITFKIAGSDLLGC